MTVPISIICLDFEICVAHKAPCLRGSFVCLIFAWYGDVCKGKSWKCYTMKIKQYYTMKIIQLLQAALLEPVTIFLATHSVSEVKN